MYDARDMSGQYTFSFTVSVLVVLKFRHFVIRSAVLIIAELGKFSEEEKLNDGEKTRAQGDGLLSVHAGAETKGTWVVKQKQCGAATTV